MEFLDKNFYHINYSVIQKFPALGKAVITHVNRCDFLPCVFDIANQLLTRHSRSLFGDHTADKEPK